MCAARDGGANDAKVDTQGCGLCEDVADLGFELGVNSRPAEAEVVLVVLRAQRQETAINVSRAPSGGCRRPRP